MPDSIQSPAFVQDPTVPGLWRYEDVRPAPFRALCTDCGVSRTSTPKDCGKACQFIQPDFPTAETRAHGRARDTAKNSDRKGGLSDELFFGVYQKLYRAKLNTPKAGAQWTGITTRLAERLLETGAVDAVLTMAPHLEDRWRPQPVLVTQADALAACRGMRMGYAPLLAMLEPARAAGHKRIAVIGIPCQVHALRKMETDLGFDSLYVIGTPCSDNTTTENFHTFLELVTDRPETVSYLEFRADYHVELRFDDGGTRDIPFLQLPISDLADDFFPLTCRTCVDYTNSLADITVGYMAGEGDQWLIVRNDRGQALLEGLAGEVHLAEPGSKGKRHGSVAGFLANTERAAGGLPLRRMPNFLRPLMGWLMPKVGPKGLEFARARVEMKAIETVLHLRAHAPQRMRAMIPDHVWRLVDAYGVTPQEGER